MRHIHIIAKFQWKKEREEEDVKEKMLKLSAESDPVSTSPNRAPPEHLRLYWPSKTNSEIPLEGCCDPGSLQDVLEKVKQVFSLQLSQTDVIVLTAEAINQLGVDAHRQAIVMLWYPDENPDCIKQSSAYGNTAKWILGGNSRVCRNGSAKDVIIAPSWCVEAESKQSLGLKVIGRWLRRIALSLTLTQPHTHTHTQSLSYLSGCLL